MGYIEEIRKLTGSRPLLLTGVGVGVLDDKGRVFLKQGFDGRWGLPGGFMELDETAEEAGRREVLEETGIEIDGLTLVTVVSGPQTFSRLENGDEYYSVTIVYAAHASGDQEPKPDGKETADARFFLPDELPEGLNQLIREQIFQYLSTIER
ncbi:ADP-ribose pyrophosphatase YjhB, NUDIX family [Bhargavaea ginsengi]|uniref:ADP-ribose pyrophosphatase YjhB, NUDIX family n=1 Tax=Bhargavaea ginsengi TaxID=426757 RepID=A0A1H6XU22_9BACL|nr:NUDIX domain-containing protein [Bhargavaea ginsengi]SEJ28055.1 ADP-ribose pyrophosphatase YjhB, NUDIX family [Bhargavaea ginsengi]